MTAQVCRHRLRLDGGWLACDTCKAAFVHRDDCTQPGSPDCLAHCAGYDQEEIAAAREAEADAEERRRAHAEGEHAFCAGECEAVISSEQLRNAILCRAMPGSAGMLNELLRRRAAQVRAEVLREVLAAIEDPQQRRGLGWESARDIVQHLINDTEEEQK